MRTHSLSEPMGVATARIPFDVAETDIEISAITLATVTDAVEVALEAPNGDVFSKADALADPSMDYAKSPDSILMRASLPLVSGGKPQRSTSSSQAQPIASSLK